MRNFIQFRSLFCASVSLALSLSPSVSRFTPRFLTMSVYFAHLYGSFIFNRNIISFTSHRTDINMFCNVSFLFVPLCVLAKCTRTAQRNAIHSLHSSITLAKNYRKNSINNCVCIRIDMTKCKIELYTV